MCNGGKHYVEIVARVNPSPMEMPNGPLGLSPEQQSRSLRDLCDSVFPIGFLNPCFQAAFGMFPIRWKLQFQLGLNTIRRIQCESF
jgi:hypothetical protein